MAAARDASAAEDSSPLAPEIEVTVGPIEDVPIYRRCGDFNLVKQLNSTGNADLWLAVNRTDRQQYTLKVFRVDLAGSREDQASLVREMENEIRRHSALHHRSIARYFHTFQADYYMNERDFRHLFALVLEPLTPPSGEPVTLADRILAAFNALRTDPEPATRKHLLPLLEHISSALFYLHGEAGGVKLRELKPANIFFNSEERAVLVDFGRAAERFSTATARAGAGTRMYFSPLRSAGEKTGSDDDIWALGIVALEMWTGTPAQQLFPNIMTTGHDRAQPVIEGILQDIRRKDLFIANIVSAMLDRDVSKRISAEQLYGSIMALGRPEPAPSTAPTTTATTTESTTTTEGGSGGGGGGSGGVHAPAPAPASGSGGAADPAASEATTGGAVSARDRAHEAREAQTVDVRATPRGVGLLLGQINALNVEVMEYKTMLEALGILAFSNLETLHDNFTTREISELQWATSTWSVLRMIEGQAPTVFTQKFIERDASLRALIAALESPLTRCSAAHILEEALRCEPRAIAERLMTAVDNLFIGIRDSEKDAKRGFFETKTVSLALSRVSGEEDPLKHPTLRAALEEIREDEGFRELVAKKAPQLRAQGRDVTDRCASILAQAVHWSTDMRRVVGSGMNLIRVERLLQCRERIASNALSIIVDLIDPDPRTGVETDAMTRESVTRTFFGNGVSFSAAARLLATNLDLDVVSAETHNNVARLVYLGVDHITRILSVPGVTSALPARPPHQHASNAKVMLTPFAALSTLSASGGASAVDSDDEPDAAGASADASASASARVAETHSAPLSTLVSERLLDLRARPSDTSATVLLQALALAAKKREGGIPAMWAAGENVFLDIVPAIAAPFTLAAFTRAREIDQRRGEDRPEPFGTYVRMGMSTPPVPSPVPALPAPTGHRVPVPMGRVKPISSLAFDVLITFLGSNQLLSTPELADHMAVVAVEATRLAVAREIESKKLAAFLYSIQHPTRNATGDAPRLRTEFLTRLAAALEPGDTLSSLFDLFASTRERKEFVYLTHILLNATKLAASSSTTSARAIHTILGFRPTRIVDVDRTGGLAAGGTAAAGGGGGGGGGGAGAGAAGVPPAAAAAAAAAGGGAVAVAPIIIGSFVPGGTVLQLLAECVYDPEVGLKVLETLKDLLSVSRASIERDAEFLGPPAVRPVTWLERWAPAEAAQIAHYTAAAEILNFVGLALRARFGPEDVARIQRATEPLFAFGGTNAGRNLIDMCAAVRRTFGIIEHVEPRIDSIDGPSANIDDI